MLTRNDENHVSVKIMTTHKIQRWAFIRMTIRLLLRMRNRGCHGTGTGKLVTTSGCVRVSLVHGSGAKWQLQCCSPRQTGRRPILTPLNRMQPRSN